MTQKQLHKLYGDEPMIGLYAVIVKRLRAVKLEPQYKIHFERGYAEGAVQMARATASAVAEYNEINLLAFGQFNGEG